MMFPQQGGAVALIFLIGAKLASRAWGSQRPHLFDSWEGFDLGVRGLLLEMKPGAKMEICHRGSGRSVEFTKLERADGAAAGLLVRVPDSEANRPHEGALKSAISEQPGAVVDVADFSALVSVSCHGPAEDLVSLGVQLSHAAFLVMDVNREDHFDFRYEGEDDAQYFRSASEEYLDHPTPMIRWSAQLTHFLARRRIKREERFRKHRRRGGS